MTTCVPELVDVEDVVAVAEVGAVVLLVALFNITIISLPLVLLILAVLINCTYFNGCYSLVVLAFSPTLPCLTALLLAAMMPDEFEPAISDVEVLLLVLTLSLIRPIFFLYRA